MNTQQGEWHLLDATDKVLGRLACEAAGLLLGKHRLEARDNQVAPVYVVITNTDKVALTGSKEQTKVYRHYTGYPGGLKERTVAQQRERDSRVIVRRAIAGMLPKNSLRDKRLLHLKLFAGAEHVHEAQLHDKS